MALTKEQLAAKFKMCTVLPGLFIGSLADAIDTVQLETNKISHIFTIIGTETLKFENSEKYHKFQLCLPDTPETDIKQYVSVANDFIHQGRKQSATLVHCRCGISRSVSFAAAYVMTVSEVSWKDALKIVMVAREIARPNHGFIKQLRTYYHSAINSERYRFRTKFPRFVDMWNDNDECEISLSKFAESGLKLKFHKHKHEEKSENDNLVVLPW